MPDLDGFTLKLRSRLLDRDVWIVPDRMTLIPKDVIAMTWDEVDVLLGSGVTREDIPRVMRIREEFGARFEPVSTIPGFIATPAPAVTPGPAPASAPDTNQMELFA